MKPKIISYQDRVIAEIKDSSINAKEKVDHE